MTARQVAEAGLADVARGAAVCVPGLPNKALVLTSSITPRSLSRRIAGMVTRSR